MRGAVMDLGSNSFKLMLAEQMGGMLKIHFEKAFVTRIGENLVNEGKITCVAMDRAMKVLRQCRLMIQKFQPDVVQVVGTSALRTAHNAGEFLTEAADILSTPIKVISGAQEARLVYSGIVSNQHWRNADVICLDLGGGSLEVTVGNEGEWLKGKSFAVGCVRMRDRFMTKYPLRGGEIPQARVFLKHEMNDFLKRISKTSERTMLVGCGGSISTLCSIHAGYFLPTQELEGFTLTLEDIARFAEKLSRMSLTQIRRMPAMPRNSADIMLPAAITFLYLMETLGIDQIHCATRGLRYGVWMDWIKPFRTVEHLEKS